jgi:hypothetical protein
MSSNVISIIPGPDFDALPEITRMSPERRDERNKRILQRISEALPMVVSILGMPKWELATRIYAMKPLSSRKPQAECQVDMQKPSGRGKWICKYAGRVSCLSS